MAEHPISHNGPVYEGSGKHAGARRAEPTPTAPASRAGPSGQVRLLLLALGTTLCLVAWGYLVWAAIDLGRNARAGDSGGSDAWMFMAIASVGAIGCLFTGLLLVVRLLRAVRERGSLPVVEHLPGGRRAKR